MRTFSLFLAATTLLFISAGCSRSQDRSAAETSIANEAPTSVGTVLSGIPENLDPSKHYLIYLHGAIVEGQGMHPTHPQYGTYQYAEILQAFSDRGFTVISEARAEGTLPNIFANHVATQVRRLLDGGVPDDHVTVVGFSKGGVIALLASASIGRGQVNWIVQAGCGSWIDKMPNFAPTGRILSQVDTADSVAGSCRALFSRMPDGSSISEDLLEIGSGHGAFYSVESQWLEPAIEWAGK